MNAINQSSEAQSAMRVYWTEKMEEAFDFYKEMRKYPIEECGEPLASLVEASEGLEVRFSTTMINNCHPRIYFIRQGLIESFRKIAREMNDKGWILKVEDGYRSPEMQRAQSHNPRHFDIILEKVMWELDGKIPTPDFMMRRLSVLIATRCRVGTHISGSAIDISVLERETGREVDRGGAYVEFSARSPMESPFVTPTQRSNREEITGIFHRYGWQAYPWEFWHYSSGDCYTEYLRRSRKPARYGAVAFDGKDIFPIGAEESDALLEPLEFYQREISAALDRLGERARSV